MNQENIFNNIIKHMTSDADCRICKMMNWAKDCPFENIPEVEKMNHEEKDKFYEKHFDELDGKCKEYLDNKLSTNIKIENQKIETTEEGSNFLNMFFNDLQNFLPKMNKV